MTHISPRHTQDLSDRHARAHHRETMRALRSQIIEVSCAMGLVILAASAGYLAAQPDLCADLPAQIIAPH